MQKSKKKINIVNLVFITVFCIVLLVYSASIIFMLCWGFLTTLKSNVDFLYMNNVMGFPNLEKSSKEFFQLANYKLILENFEFTRRTRFYSGDTLIVHETQNNLGSMLVNTVLYAGVGSVILAVVPAITAFACVKFKRYKLSKIIYVANLVTMSLPLVGTAPATLNMMRYLNLYDSFIGNYIQKFSFCGMYFLVFYAFYEGLPDSYQEAAEIDGASYYGILIKIIIPLSIKVISSVVLLQFVQLWNDYQTPLMYLPTHPTLAYGTYYMAQGNTAGALSKVPVRIAACMILALPILVVFLFARNKLMGNVSIGGVKE